VAPTADTGAADALSTADVRPDVVTFNDAGLDTAVDTGVDAALVLDAAIDMAVASDIRADTVAPGDTRADVASDARVGDAATISPAGHACIDDTACGSLVCDTSLPGGFCSGTCTNSTSQPAERAMCGGEGSTCLTIGDSMPQSFCTQACRPELSSTGCRANQVCTGWWFTHAFKTPDSPGCQFFCHADSECLAGTRCSRFGTCAAAIAPATNLPDGAACDPTLDTAGSPSAQCRGGCFLVSPTVPTQGLCGSLVDTQRLPTPGGCADGDPAVAPSTPFGDNLALCLFRDCACDGDCRSPLQCVITTTGSGICIYVDTTVGEHGTPCPADGGIRD
jgi:hypothetical protein